MVIRVVEQQDLHFATVVLIDYACAHVDAVLGCKARAGGDAAVGSGWNSDGDTSGDNGLATLRNLCVFGAVGFVS